MNSCYCSYYSLFLTMDKCRQKHSKIRKFSFSEEVSSIEWEFIDMTDQEQDIITRMHNLVGDKWALIAGRVPGRKAEEIERFWLMRNSDTFKDKRKQATRIQHS
ncbi:hypothetical protein ACS0TY_002389 [Phlomoides rotata]